METHRTATVSQAIALFDEQKYQEAFKMFVDVYHQSQDAAEQQQIFQILEEAYYLPNEEELRQTYDANVTLLKNYPYFWNKSFRSFDDLSFQLFPVSDELYYRYSRSGHRFSGAYDAKSSQQMRYFFEDLGQPLRVQDEDNFYNLTFLNDNVRRSEDFAGDNHIYLIYTSLEPLERLMLACDLEPILQQQKFVFLVGEKNWGKYPINFRKKFGIDYSKMKPTPIRIDEIKRICFWYKHAYSGTELSLAVLGSVNEIQMCSGYDFDTNSTKEGYPLYFTPEFRDILSRPDDTYTVDQVENLVRSEKYDIHLKELDMYLGWLRHQRSAPHTYTVKELFCGYFLFQYEKRGINPRIVPTLLFDPHMWDTSAYDKIILSFPYCTVLTSMREPIMTFGRAYLYGLIGWNKFQTQYILGSDYEHTRFLPLELLDCYYGFRFEDLKTRPEAVCHAVCRHLNVPYEPQMLETEAPVADRSGNITKGFDQSPLHRDISAVLSEFDQLRLKMFYEPIHRYYGYPAFSFDEHPVPEETVRALFRVPFRFEHMNHKIFKEAPSQDVLHEWIQEALQKMWRKKFVAPKLIPLEDTCNE